MEMQQRPLITVGLPSAFIALVGTAVGMLLAFVSAFLPGTNIRLRMKL
jgi:hypothetical protein